MVGLDISGCGQGIQHQIRFRDNLSVLEGIVFDWRGILTVELVIVSIVVVVNRPTLCYAMLT